MRTRIHREPAVEVATSVEQASNDLLESFIGTREERERVAKSQKQRRKTGCGSKARRTELIAEIEKRIALQDWSNITPSLLVALYWSCHLKVYGITPAEIDSTSKWATAVKMAASFIKTQFDGDVQMTVRFMRWLWTREQTREQWRRQQQRSGMRITWYQQFGRYEYVSDWRADKVRRQG